MRMRVRSFSSRMVSLNPYYHLEGLDRVTPFRVYCLRWRWICSSKACPHTLEFP
jgi:hypothetical protein